MTEEERVERLWREGYGWFGDICPDCGAELMYKEIEEFPASMPGLISIYLECPCCGHRETRYDG